MATEVRDVRITDISIGSRHRKDVGDLAELRRSIQDVGLLHPVVLTKDRLLVAGARRLAAFKQMGRETIPAFIAPNLADVLELLKAERDENVCRKDFTPIEAAEVGRALEEMERPKAEASRIAGNRAGGKGGEVAGKKPASFGRVRDKVGEAVGMSGRSYQKAKTVVEAAEQDPDTFGPIAEEMDRTGKIGPAYEQVQQIKKGKRPEPKQNTEQNGRKAVGVLRANEAIDCLMRIPKNDPHRKRGFQIVTDWIKLNK